MAQTESGSPRVAVLAGDDAHPMVKIVERLAKPAGLAVFAVYSGANDVAEALRVSSQLPIVPVRERTRVKVDHVYVIDHDDDVTLEHGEIVVSSGTQHASGRLDRLLRSVADAVGRDAAAVILTGRGTDGALGIKRIKETGGFTIAQAPASDSDSEMPNAAIATGMVDLVVPVEEIAQRLLLLGREPARASPFEDEDRSSPSETDTLRDILTLVRIRSGHDFGPYKRATLHRRVSRRMQVCNTETLGDYHRYLREHPTELSNLMRDFLICVTNFFRDAEAYAQLQANVIPKLFANKTRSGQVRVWVAGCATGEEAYSVGIMLLEHASRLSDPPQIQIFATDIDENALAEARQGRYPDTISVDVAPSRLGRYFTRENGHYRVSKELRELVLFSPHNVLRDPPFSRLDLITCRNLLIYLNRDAQDRILTMFHFGLRADGFLFLGSSESAENTALFATVDAKHRVFSRTPAQTQLGMDGIVPTQRWYPSLPPNAAPPERVKSVGELHHKLVERYAPPSVLANDDLDVVHVSEHAGRFLEIAGGEPTRQLLRLVHPALRLELRTAIYASRQNPQKGDTRRVDFQEDGKPRSVEMRVRAVDAAELGNHAVLVTFDEVEAAPEGTAPAPESSYIEPVVREIEDELHRTRDQLRTTIEQYETSLEELKASNEELQAINEELRSASEELETSKEEMQSVNEELTTLNHELKVKVDEVSHANSDLQNLMSSTDIGVVFLDRQLNIKRFTPRMQDLINVIPSDIGRPLAHLTHRLDTEELPELARTVLQNLRTIEREFASRNGQRYLVRLLPYRSLEDRIDGVVMTFVEVSDLRNAIDARRRSEAALLVSEERVRLALRNAPMIVLNLDRTGAVQWGYVRGTELAAGTQIQDMFAPGQSTLFAEIIRRVRDANFGQRAELDLVVDGAPHTYDFRIEPSNGGVNAVGFDITPSKLAEATLRETDRRKDEFLATLSHELRNPLTPLRVALDVAKLAPDDGRQQAEAIAIMDRQVTQMTQLVDDLLDLSRITQGKIALERVRVDPAQLVDAAVEAIRPLIMQRHHELRISSRTAGYHVVGDQQRLTQVLVNLLSNAAKYTPDGGHIDLEVVADRDREMLVMRVRDDGLGIAKHVLPEIFDIFVQSRDALGRAAGGLGIGLNVVRRLVELHGGRVAASSPGENKGSEFVVELPLGH